MCHFIKLSLETEFHGYALKFYLFSTLVKSMLEFINLHQFAFLWNWSGEGILDSIRIQAQ